MEKIVDHVENRVRALGENEVSTTMIGEYVMEDLVDLDEIAYIRFASVYRQFKDMSVFLKELQDIVEKAKEPSDPQETADNQENRRSLNGGQHITKSIVSCLQKSSTNN